MKVMVVISRLLTFSGRCSFEQDPWDVFTVISFDLVEKLEESKSLEFGGRI
jgi:hypothetical protein